jgi:hypothetical protein
MRQLSLDDKENIMNAQKLRDEQQIWQAMECIQSEINSLSIAIEKAEQNNKKSPLIPVLKEDRIRRIGKVEILKWVLHI